MKGRASQTRERLSVLPASLDFLLRSAEDQYHNSLYELSNASPVLLVFLRSFGCCFCREALQDTRQALPSLRASGVKLVLLHMSSEEEASHVLAGYGLADIPRISNEDQSLYRSFGLGRSTLDKLLAPRVLARAIEALLHGNPIGFSAGDGLQMPGVFLIHKGRLLQTFLPDTVDCRPDYVKIAGCESLVTR